MIRDEDLRSVLDYSEGQKEAARRVLIELANLFAQYRDDIRIVGGWVPDLMFPEEGHIGSIDVDLLINHLELKDSGYQTMARILLHNGYREHPEKYFSFVKPVEINGVAYDVDVDILAGMYGGTVSRKRSQHVQGIKALKATGGNFAFDFPPQEVKVEARRPDGAYDTAHISVVAVVPYLVMKAAALGRGKPKDAYDIYFLVRHYVGGPAEIAKLFRNCCDLRIVSEMQVKLKEKFASPEHAGPVDVAAFMDLEDEEETELIKRDACELIMDLTRRIDLLKDENRVH